MLALLPLISCTENSRAKNWGGSETIYLPKNRKLVNVTWKEDELWYLTAPMSKEDKPQTHKFQEKSSWGVMEGTITIIESKDEDWKYYH